MKALIIGCGDIGRRIGARLRRRGDSVTGLVRTAASAAVLEKMGIDPVVAELDDAATLPCFEIFNQVFLLAPPPGHGTTDPRTESLLARLAAAVPGHLVYLGTTAVYGDQRGKVVTEDTPPAPSSERGQRRLHAEKLIREFAAASGCPATILRVAAIYGPGRIPVERLKNGAPVLDSEFSGPGNRIHADDLAKLCVAAADQPAGARIYNVSDNNPLPQAEYLDQLADLLGLKRPPRMTWRQAEQSLSATQLEFLRDRRQVDASRILRDLDVELDYANLGDGLRASITP